MVGDWKRERTGGGGGRVRMAVKSIVHTILKLKGFFCQKPGVEGGI